jgi:hypothetical protein
MPFSPHALAGHHRGLVPPGRALVHRAPAGAASAQASADAPGPGVEAPTRPRSRLPPHAPPRRRRTPLPRRTVKPAKQVDCPAKVLRESARSNISRLCASVDTVNPLPSRPRCSAGDSASSRTGAWRLLRNPKVAAVRRGATARAGGPRPVAGSRCHSETDAGSPRSDRAARAQQAAARNRGTELGGSAQPRPVARSSEIQLRELARYLSPSASARSRPDLLHLLARVPLPPGHVAGDPSR